MIDILASVSSTSAACVERRLRAGLCCCKLVLCSCIFQTSRPLFSPKVNLFLFCNCLSPRKNRARKFCLSNGPSRISVTYLGIAINLSGALSPMSTCIPCTNVVDKVYLIEETFFFMSTTFETMITSRFFTLFIFRFSFTAVSEFFLLLLTWVRR